MHKALPQHDSSQWHPKRGFTDRSERFSQDIQRPLPKGNVFLISRANLPPTSRRRRQKPHQLPHQLPLRKSDHVALITTASFRHPHHTRKQKPKRHRQQRQFLRLARHHPPPRHSPPLHPTPTAAQRSSSARGSRGPWSGRRGPRRYGRGQRTLRECLCPLSQRSPTTAA